MPVATRRATSSWRGLSGSGSGARLGGAARGRLLVGEPEHHLRPELEQVSLAEDREADARAVDERTIRRVEVEDRDEPVARDDQLGVTARQTALGEAKLCLRVASQRQLAALEQERLAATGAGDHPEDRQRRGAAAVEGHRRRLVASSRAGTRAR